MTDIKVLEREMECVRRKAKINCTNCGSCDLRMDDSRILAAYSRAIDALRAQQEPKSPCWVCGYGGRYLDVPPCAPNGIGDSGCPAHPKLPAKGAADRE